MTLTKDALSPLGIRTPGPTINDLPPAARAFLEQKGSLRLYRRNEFVQRHLVPPDAASWLQTGRLWAGIYLPDGAEQRHGWEMRGELFGIYNMLQPGSPSRNNMVVDTDEALVLHFSRELLLEMMRTIPGASEGIAIGLSRRITQVHDFIAMHGPRALVDKIRAVLVSWASQYSVAALDGSIEIWMSQTDLANAVGASRQRVHAELKALQALGEVTLAYRKIILRPKLYTPNRP